MFARKATRTVFLFSVLAAQLISKITCESVVRIADADELIKLSEEVNKGMTYQGATVFLDADIDLSDEAFDPAGFSEGPSSSGFMGTFNGQGYTINGLVINSSFPHVGLFGHSNGMQVKNIVLGPSCSVNSPNGGLASSTVGGIVGRCESSSGPCIVENSVSMANVSFTGSASGIVKIGGVAGGLSLVAYDVIVKNCANYGTVTFAGTTAEASASFRISAGGIVGHFSGAGMDVTPHIQNCLNYGTVGHSVIVSDGNVFLGGIAGLSNVAVSFENCVSTGKVESIGSHFSKGGVIGGTEASLSIAHCLWTADAGNVSACGITINGATTPVITVVDSSSAELDSVTVNGLNTYTESRDGWNKWLLNTGNNTVRFVVNGSATVSIKSQLILQPDPSAEPGYLFNGWYTAPSCTALFNSSVITRDVTLYGKWERKGSESQSDNKIVVFTIQVVFDTKKLGDIDAKGIIKEIVEGEETDAVIEEVADRDSGEVMFIINIYDPTTDESTVKNIISTIKSFDVMRDALVIIKVTDATGGYYDKEINGDKGGSVNIIVVIVVVVVVVFIALVVAVCVVFLMRSRTKRSNFELEAVSI